MPEDLVLAVRLEESAWVHSEGVHETVSLQKCIEAGSSATLEGSQGVCVNHDVGCVVSDRNETKN